MSLVIDHDNVTPLSTIGRWTPVLNGDVYCSPACGGRCKKAEFDRVSEQAGVLAAQLGSGWMPIVWENLGWHFQVKKGSFTICDESPKGYSAYIEFSFDSRKAERISAIDADPRTAVQRVIDIVNSKINVLKRSLMSATLDSLEIEDV
jgi:hypothetical protein